MIFLNSKRIIIPRNFAPSCIYGQLQRCIIQPVPIMHAQYDQRYDATFQNDCDNCETIPSVLVIDSAYRDVSTDTPSDYTVTFINKYPDATSIELVYAGIPNSNYNITTNNNTLHVMPTGTMTAIINYSGGTCTPGAASIGVATVHTFDSLTGATRPGTGLCHRSGVMLYALNGKHATASGPYIIYKPKKVTHYRAVDKYRVLKDPYKFYQEKGTQGFCQMFAYFLATDITDGFNIVDQITSIGPLKFHLLARNTFVCLQKILALLKSDKEFYQRFQDSYNDVDKTYYGIRPRTTFKRFVTDLGKLDLLDATYYIYDNPLNGVTTKAHRESLWSTIDHPS